METNQLKSESIIAEENSYLKGEKFEKLFAEYMKAELGWEKYVIRSQQKGKYKSRGSQVDIVGERKDDRHRRLYNLGIVLVGLFLIGLVTGISIMELYQLDDGFYIAIVGMVIGIIGVFCIWDSNNFQKENAWVECKNRKTKSTYEDVQKSINELKDYKDSGDKEYKFVQHYFVSASGFVENALKLAQDNNIECFEYEEGHFVPVHYWK
jgi:uncharacterized protein YxeA